MEEKRAAEDAAEGEPMPKRARAADASASPAAAPLSLSFLKPGSNIQLADVQDLVLNTLIGTPEPSWVRLHKAEGAEVARVMVVMLCGLDHSLWSEQCDSLPCLRERFEPPVRVYGVAANATTTQSVVAFMQCKQPYAHQRRKDADKTDPTKRKSTAAVQRVDKTAPMPFPPSYYQLTPGEMADNNYPLPVLHAETGELRCPEGFVVTQPAGAGVARSPHPAMLALDCEMCYTSAGLEVARCSVVDGEGAVVFDSLILPPRPITDYNTQYSGITAAHMEGVTTSLAQAQAALLALVAEETLLVGHSLENDLQALKLLHRSAADTALLYPHPRGPPFKPALRVLSERLLGRRIQEGNHDSVADARATMALARLKFARGPAFGEPRPEGVPLLQLLCDASRRATLVDRPKALQRLTTGSASAVQAASDGEVVARAAREAAREQAGGAAGGGPHLLWCSLCDLSTLQEARAQRRRRRWEEGLAAAAAGEAAAEAAAVSSREQEAEEEARTAAALRAADGHVATLLDAAPAGTLVLVLSGHGDTPAARRLLEQKFRRNQGLSGGPWGESDEAALTAATDRARNGLVWATIKT